jgi:DNA primase
MSFSPVRDQIKQTIKDAADIVQVIGEHVELKRAGSRFTGRCPFHSEKTPSFSVNPQGQFYHCFGCGEHGDVFSFVMKYHHMEFPEALAMLARKFGVELPERQLSASEQAALHHRDLLYRANEEAVSVYQQCLRHPKWGKNARSYLERRGMPGEIVERYRLGYAPEIEQAGWSYLSDQLAAKELTAEIIEQAGLAVRNDRGGFYDRFRSRIMFPINDMTGRVVAFGGRILGDGRPKYMNSPESPIFEKSRLLFGLQQHRQAIRQARRALVVEGNFDLLSLAVHGIDNVVAPLGTALTRMHIQSLRGYCREVVLLFDADAAGLKAAMRCIPFLLAERMEGRVALLPAGHDPDSFVREKGPAAVAELVEAARPLPEFAFDTLVREHGLTLAGKNRIVGELQQLLAQAADAELRELMSAHFSEKLGVSPGYFRGKAGPVAPRPGTVTEKPITGVDEMGRQDRQLVDFLIHHPELYAQLHEAGMEQVVLHPLALQIVVHVGRLAQAGCRQPEELLTDLENDMVRDYIVRRLTALPSFAGDEEEGGEDGAMMEELCRWLRLELQRRDGASLQERIAEAERQGNTAVLMELLGEKLALDRKKTKLFI